jgi:hypothetical protein
MHISFYFTCLKKTQIVFVGDYLAFPTSQSNWFIKVFQVSIPSSNEVIAVKGKEMTWTDDLRFGKGLHVITAHHAFHERFWKCLWSNILVDVFPFSDVWYPQTHILLQTGMIVWYLEIVRMVTINRYPLYPQIQLGMYI